MVTHADAERGRQQGQDVEGAEGLLGLLWQMRRHRQGCDAINRMLHGGTGTTLPRHAHPGVAGTLLVKALLTAAIC